MGEKFLKIVRTIITLIAGVLAIIMLTSNDHSQNDEVMPYMLFCLVIMQIFDGVDYYKKGKKIQSILWFLLAILIGSTTILIIYRR